MRKEQCTALLAAAAAAAAAVWGWRMKASRRKQKRHRVVKLRVDWMRIVICMYPALHTPSADCCILLLPSGTH